MPTGGVRAEREKRREVERGKGDRVIRAGTACRYSIFIRRDPLSPSSVPSLPPLSILPSRLVSFLLFQPLPPGRDSDDAASKSRPK